jgi:O-antigen/teichoic acid export membrane protein
LRQGISYSLLRWITMVYNRADMILLESFLGAGAVGLYGAAYRLMEVFKLVPNMAERILLPIMSRTIGAAGELRGVLERSLKALAAVAIPLALGAWALREQGMRTVFGPAYLEGASAWAVLMTALIVICLSRPFLTLLRAQGRMREACALAAGAVVINILLNLWLIPSWGILAPAFATGAAELLFLVSLWWVCRGAIPVKALRGFASLLPAAAAMGLAVLLAGRWPYLAAIGGAALYLVLLLAGRGLDHEDREGLKEMIRG